MNQTTITVPNWLFDGAKAIDNNWVIFAVALVTAFVVGFVVEYIKHRYTLKQGKALATLTVHKALLVSATVMTALQYYLPFLQQHLRSLETLPYIGSYALSIYGAANFLYALKGKVWYQNILKTAEKLDKAATAPSLQPTLTVPNLPETESDFEVQ